MFTPHSRLHPTQPRSTPAQDLFFTNFISCKDIKASLHRLPSKPLAKPRPEQPYPTLTRILYTLTPAQQDDTIMAPARSSVGRTIALEYTYIRVRCIGVGGRQPAHPLRRRHRGVPQPVRPRAEQLLAARGGLQLTDMAAPY